MSIRAEHLQGIIRRISGNERITRIWVLDHMIDIISEYVGIEEANRVQKLYMDWVLDKGGNYNDFKQLFTEILAKAKDLPEAVKWRLNAYRDYLFPGPMPE